MSLCDLCAIFSWQLWSRILSSEIFLLQKWHQLPLFLTKSPWSLVEFSCSSDFLKVQIYMKKSLKTKWILYVTFLTSSDYQTFWRKLRADSRTVERSVFYKFYEETVLRLHFPRPTNYGSPNGRFCKVGVGMIKYPFRVKYWNDFFLLWERVVRKIKGRFSKNVKF